MLCKNIFRMIFIFTIASLQINAQDRHQLDVKTIMQDPEVWMGSLPQNPYWSEDGKTIYFSWNPENADSDSLYAITATGGTPRKISLKEQEKLPARYGDYTADYKFKVFSLHGDIFVFDIKRNKLEQITATLSS